MVTYKPILYFIENDLGFKYKTHYSDVIQTFLPMVCEPRLKEIEGAAVEIPGCMIYDKRLRESISKQKKTENS